MSLDESLAAVKKYYSRKVASYGPTPIGVDWNSAESQLLRFEQILKVCDTSRPFSINDYGAGYGALVDHIVARGDEFTYCGFDISEQMIATAQAYHKQQPNCLFVTDESMLTAADYAVASGVLNVKLQTPIEEWENHVLRTLQRMHELSTKGFAFNVLTSYSDRDHMRPDLYYADPCFLFDYCKKRFSQDVALLHDYGLYEFTMLVRK